MVVRVRSGSRLGLGLMVKSYGCGLRVGVCVERVRIERARGLRLDNVRG